ncbi:MAG: PQQ-binding-like beta-propeller repeat protein, partial [Planctomycetota bacterium]
TPGGPVDLPPTIHGNLVLFGCRDGYVYCLRASDGKMAWRFRAAPRDTRTLDRERLESVWPVPGSVLVMDGVAYVSAGRSTYLDGGVRLYGLDPQPGEVLFKNRVDSEHPGLSKVENRGAERKVIDQNIVDRVSQRAPDQSDAFSMQGGALNDVLVSDGYSIYMKHMRFGPELERREKPGRHLFSTSRLLNTVEVHRSHWVLGTGDFSRVPVAYSWIANSRSGRGDLRLGRPYGIMLAFERDTAWGVWRRMNKEGYTIYAQPKEPFRREPKGRRDFRRFENRDMPAMCWRKKMVMRPRAMLKAGENLFFGGCPDQSRADDPLAVYRGKKDGLLWVYSAADGEKRATYRLPSSVTWDGMAAAGGRIYVSLENGRLLCLAGEAK